MRPWFRPAEDRLDPAERAYVMARDGQCVAAQIDPEHRCEGPDGFDHVPERDQNGLGSRAPSDRFHGVRLCWGANVNGWASAHRDEERAWIAAIEG